jgi:hypothetical protein
MKKWTYSGAAVAAGTEDGVVIAVVDGIVTPASAGLIIADSVHWSRYRLAQVVRYDRAAVNLTAEVLFATALRASAGSTPTALVVSMDQLPMFREYSQMHADRGVMKAAFTCAEAAQRWAADQARVRESWGRWRRALAASP